MNLIALRKRSNSYKDNNENPCLSRGLVKDLQTHVPVRICNMFKMISLNIPTKSPASLHHFIRRSNIVPPIPEADGTFCHIWIHRIISSMVSEQAFPPLQRPVGSAHLSHRLAGEEERKTHITLGPVSRRC